MGIDLRLAIPIIIGTIPLMIAPPAPPPPVPDLPEAFENPPPPVAEGTEPVAPSGKLFNFLVVKRWMFFL